VNSQGSYRVTFQLDRPGVDSVAMKPILPYRSFSHLLYEIPTEALIMERLTASVNIIDIYGFCGVTTMIELMPKEISEKIQPGKGRTSQTDLDELQVTDVQSKNNFSPWEKLLLALDMAQALADLHGFKDGVIIHGDNHIEQFLINAEGRMKLGDFNLATILEWNDKKQEYCKRQRKPWRFQVSQFYLSSYVV
jgi:hypothetical protein